MYRPFPHNAAESVQAATRAVQSQATADAAATSTPNKFRITATPTPFSLDGLIKDLEESAKTKYFRGLFERGPDLEKLTKCVQGSKQKLKHQEKELLVQVAQHFEELNQYREEIRKKYHQSGNEQLGRVSVFLDACEKSEIPIFKFPPYIKAEYGQKLLDRIHGDWNFQRMIKTDAESAAQAEADVNVNLTHIDNETNEKKNICINSRLYKDISGRTMTGNIDIILPGNEPKRIYGVEKHRSLVSQGLGEDVVEAQIAHELQHSLLEYVPCLKGLETIPTTIQYAISQRGFADISMAFTSLISIIGAGSIGAFYITAKKPSAEQLIVADEKGLVIKYISKIPLYFGEDRQNIVGCLSSHVSCKLTTENRGVDWQEEWTKLADLRVIFTNTQGEYDDQWFSPFLVDKIDEITGATAIDTNTQRPVQVPLVWRTIEDFEKAF